MREKQMNDEINFQTGGKDLKIFIITAFVVLGLVFAWLYARPAKTSSGLSFANQHDIAYIYSSQQGAARLESSAGSALQAINPHGSTSEAGRAQSLASTSQGSLPPSSAKSDSYQAANPKASFSVNSRSVDAASTPENSADEKTHSAKKNDSASSHDKSNKSASGLKE
jgi:hypothetical protein